MRCVQFVRVILALVLATGCGDSGGGATDGNTVNGIQYSAAFASVPGTGSGALNLIATLKNVSTVTQDRTYPLSCPVRVRLYRQADGLRLYDETRLACQSETMGTISVLPGESRQLTSGVRTQSYILGDSMAVATYIVRAVIQTEGTTRELEVEAGVWTFQ